MARKLLYGRNKKIAKRGPFKKRALPRFRRRRFGGIPRGPRTLSNIPQLQKFRYTEFFGLTMTTGVMAKYVFSANSLNSPSITGVGHQPLRYDQMAVFFDHYVVVGSKITAKIVGRLRSDADTIPFAWGIALDDNANIATDYRTLVEQGRTPYRLNNGSSALDTQRITHKFSAKKWFNIANIKDNVNHLGAAVTANPADQAYFTVWAQPVDQASTGSTFNFVVTLDFIALFSEPKDLATSTV